MLLHHPSASWNLTYGDDAVGGPLLLETQGKPLFRAMHCALDGQPEAPLTQSVASYVRKGGCAILQSKGTFPGQAPVEILQTQRIAANTIRFTYDITWKAEGAPLKQGLELGSLRLEGNWTRYLALSPREVAQTPPEWRPLPQDLDKTPLVLAPIPTVLLLEDQEGRRLEYGLGHDLWRWQKGLNGEFLHATNRLTLSRDQEGLLLQRHVAYCDPQEEARLAARLQSTPPFAADPESGAPGRPVPVSCPEKRQYRFQAYLSWSEPALAPQPLSPESSPLELTCTQQGGLQNLSQAIPEGVPPCLVLNLATIPFPQNSHVERDATPGAPPCWESRAFQALFRRCLRQIANAGAEGTLILKGVAPGECQRASHLARRGEALPHWDLSAILETLAWARQILPETWSLRADVAAPWDLLPSLSVLGAPSGFRHAQE